MDGGVFAARKRMIIYYDTEFTTLDGNIDWDMISAGFVAEDGRAWYAEISDFDRETCSEFVVETVLPLLEHRPESTMTGKEFGARLVDWLRQFDEEIELVPDARCDQTLVEIYAGEAFRKFAQPVRFRVWRVSELEDVQTVLANVEQKFWSKSPGWQHHALYDALRLKLLVETQTQQLAAE